MLQLTSVRIRRAEGPISLCTGWHTFEGVDAETRGNAYLREISETAPQNGCYDKTDVRMIFANGQEWNARFDVKHFSCEDSDTNLRQHVKDFLYFQLNPARIPWIEKLATSISSVKREQAAGHVRSILSHWTAEERTEAQALLDLL